MKSFIKEGNRFREIKMKMNLSLAKIAKISHFVPQRPRRFVRNVLTRITTPKDLKPYRPPYHGKIKAPCGINLYGLFRAENGLAQGAKLYAKALSFTTIPYVLVNTDFMEKLPQNDHSLDSILAPKGKYGINLIHLNGDHLETACRKFPHSAFDYHYNIGVWLWELEKLPPAFTKALDYVDELWAPSEFVKNAIQRSTDKPVITIPYGIETPKENLVRSNFGLPENDFLVLTMYDSLSFSSRKNPEAAITAFYQAFHDSSRAVLVIKVSNAREDELRLLSSRLEKLKIRYALISEQLPKPRLNALISCCDVFISLHRSEGFGLVIAEAMSLGVPVVATGWSANTEFMAEDCTCRTKYKLIPLGENYMYGDKSDRWADPDIEDAANKLRLLYSDPVLRNEMAAKAQSYINNEYSIQRTAELIASRYAEICHII